MTLNLFHGPILVSFYAPKNRKIWFSDAFQEVEKQTSPMKWAKDIFNK